jgi:hypothetical protein
MILPQKKDLSCKPFRILLFILFLIQPLFSQQTFLEINGVVSIEAEHYTGNKGPWEEVEGRNAVSIDDAGFGAFDETKILIKDGDHPAAGGLTGVVSIMENGESINWGIPNENAQNIAVSEKILSRSALFVYEKDAIMPGLKAPDKRVGMFLRSASANEAGWKIFDATMRWAVKQQPDSLREVLFITHYRDSSEMDDKIQDRIERLGYQVILIEDDSVNRDDANSKAFVVISESVNSNSIGNKFRYSKTPIIVCEPHLYDDMGMVIFKPVWVETEGQFPNAMMIRRGKWSDNLRYSIYFTTPGIYNLWLLGKSGGDAGADEVKIFFDTDSIYSDALFYEIQFSKELQWTNQMFFKTPLNLKTPGNSEINVKKAGWHNLFLVKGAEPEDPLHPPDTRKYPNWRVDKIIIYKEGTIPEGDGPLETRNNQQVEVPDSLLIDKEFWPKQIWVEMNGYVILEAEDIDCDEYWQLKDEPKGYTGKGYLEWQGPDRTRSIEGLGGNDDLIYVRQGPQEEWLIIRVFTSQQGYYGVNVRNIHQNIDGDNDAWIAPVGFHPNRKRGTKIQRIGDSFNDGKGFTWLDWGIQRFWFRNGLNNIYIGGRSVGFGIDRIAIYRDDDEQAKTKALDLYRPVSKLKSQDSRTLE